MKKKIQKKLLYILLFFIIIGVLLFINNIRALTSSAILSARATNTPVKNSSSVNVNKTISKEYSFMLAKNTNTKIEFGGNYRNISFNDYKKWNPKKENETDEQVLQRYNNATNGKVLTYADSNIKNSLYILYKNIGKYNGKTINVKMTVIDFAPSSNPTGPSYIYLNMGDIGNTVHGVDWITFKYEFFDNDTGEAVSIKGNTSYWDVDVWQGVILHDNVVGIYSTSDSKLVMNKVNNAPFIYDITSKNFDYDNTENLVDTMYAFTETFSGTSLTRTFSYGYISNDGTSNASYKPNSSGGIFNSGNTVVNIEEGDPIKEVNKEIITKDEEYTYTIKQYVPKLLSQYYYKSLTIEDTLEDVLEANASNVSVKDEKNADVTSRFNINVQGQKITLTPQNLNSSDLYGHTYIINIKTKVKENADLSSYKEGNYYEVPNKAKRTYKDYNNVEIVDETEEVKIKVKVPVTVNYEIVTENNPPANLTDETPSDENKYAGEEYEPKDELTTRYTEKRCTFKGWYTTRSLTGEKYEGSSLTDDLTLYGGWTCDDKVEINYHQVGDSVPNQTSLPEREEKYVNDTYTAKPVLTTTYKDKKCDFNGWYTNSNLTGGKYTNGVLTGNLDLYGKWECVDLIKEPNKEVTKTNIKAKEEYTYKITHEVPNIEDSNYYYSKYEITDNIDEVLRVNSIKVETETQEDVTDKFNITGTNNILIKPNSLTDPSFYNHTYTYIIKVQLKENQNMSGHTKEGNEYKIENKGKATVNNNELETEQIEVKVKEVTVNYEIVTENNPPANLTDETPSSETKLIGEEYTAKGGLTTRYTEERCTFKGWYTNRNLTGAKYTQGDLTDNLNLYGGWDCSGKAEINYHLVGDPVPNQTSLPEREEKYIGDEYTAKPVLTTTYKDKKCTFNGWYTNSSLTGGKYTNGVLSGNLDLYGKWECVDLIKEPSKEATKQKVKEGEEYTYKITHEVPNIEDSNYYYSAYKITDNIDPGLEIKNIKVEAEENDVTNNFNIISANNNVIITPKNLNNQEFYNHTYTYIITVKVSLQENGLDIEEYKETDRYVINNKGKVQVNSNELETETVKVTYIPKYTLTVHHYKENTTEKLGESTEEEKYAGDEYRTSALTNIEEGYELVGAPNNAEGTIEEDTVVIYYYKLKDLTLTVHHYKEGTEEELAQTETYNKKYGDEYTTNKSNSVAEEYELVEEPSNKEGTIKENITVNYYYRLKKGKLIVKHLEYGTNAKLTNDEVEENINYTTEYETHESRNIPANYILKERTENYSGVIDKEETIVTYYYQKKDSNIVPTITKEGTEEINNINSKVNYKINYKANFTDYIGTAIITIKDKLPYKIDEANSSLDGGVYNEEEKTITWTEEVEINSYENSKKEITKNIEVKYLNIDPKQRIITNEVEGNIKGDNKDITVENNYNTRVLIPGEIIIKYIDKSTGEDIIPQIKTTNLVGEDYTLPIEKEIEGYKLIEKPEETEYEYKENTQIIKYYYERIKLKVETKAKEGGTIEGNENVYYGDDSTKDKIRIKANPGYVIDKIKINGKDIEVPENSSEMTISNFIKMTEDKLVEVTFKTKPQVVTVPKTSSFISKIVLIIGFIFIITSSIYIYSKTKNNA